MNDRLAQIEDRAKSFHATVWLGDGGEPAGILYEVADEMADDVLALVEIAKAAQKHWEAVRNFTGDEIASSGRSATSPTGVFATLGPLARALSVLDDREET